MQSAPQPVSCTQGAGLIGTLKRWIPDKGFGFIFPDNGTDSFFAHMRQFAGDNKAVIMEGARVMYQTEMNDRSQKIQASTWAVIGGASPVPVATNSYAVPTMMDPSQNYMQQMAQPAPQPVPQPVNSMPVGGQIGTLKRWNSEKGFGFVFPDDGSDSFFAHSRQLVGIAQSDVYEGMRVSYQIEMNTRSGKLQAGAWSIATANAVPVATPANGDMNANFQAAVTPPPVPMPTLTPMQTPAAMPVPMMAPVTDPTQMYTQSMPMVPQVPQVPPVPQAPPAHDLPTTKEVEVPARCITDIMGGLEEINKNAGGDIRIELVPPAIDGDMRLLKVTGPPVSASLGAVLLLQRLCELM